MEPFSVWICDECGCEVSDPALVEAQDGECACGGEYKQDFRQAHGLAYKVGCLDRAGEDFFRTTIDLGEMAIHYVPDAFYKAIGTENCVDLLIYAVRSRTWFVHDSKMARGYSIKAYTPSSALLAAANAGVESAKMTEDAVNHPAHYTKTKVEPIDPIEAWAETWPVKVAFHLGNVVKYIARAGLKGNTLEDLKKAQWYLNRAISKLEKSE